MSGTIGSGVVQNGPEFVGPPAPVPAFDAFLSEEGAVPCGLADMRNAGRQVGVESVCPNIACISYNPASWKEAAWAWWREVRRRGRCPVCNTITGRHQLPQLPRWMIEVAHVDVAAVWHGRAISNVGNATQVVIREPIPSRYMPEGFDADTAGLAVRLAPFGWEYGPTDGTWATHVTEAGIAHLRRDLAAGAMGAELQEVVTEERLGLGHISMSWHTFDDMVRRCYNWPPTMDPTRLHVQIRRLAETYGWQTSSLREAAGTELGWRISRRRRTRRRRMWRRYVEPA